MDTPSPLWDLDRAVGFPPRAVSLLITQLEPAGYAVAGAVVMGPDGEPVVELDAVASADGHLVAFETAAALWAALKATFDEQTVRLDYVVEGMRGFGGTGDGFDDELRELSATWACGDPTDGKDASVIPSGYYCADCPYREFRHDKPPQQDGYCRYLEWGDWMTYGGASMLWDGLKRCGVRLGDP